MCNMFYGAFRLCEWLLETTPSMYFLDFSAPHKPKTSCKTNIAYETCLRIRRILVQQSCKGEEFSSRRFGDVAALVLVVGSSDSSGSTCVTECSSDRTERSVAPYDVYMIEEHMINPLR